jgi:hypothetical protein
MSRITRSTAVLSAALLATGVAAALNKSAPAAAEAAYVYAAPDGSGISCSQPRPCSLTQAQQRERHILETDEALAKDVVVQLADGTYRLSASLRFAPADSGRNGHRVYWEAAPGAHPVLSGAVRVTGWTLTDPAKNVWSAPVPADLDTRQVYVDGTEAPIAQTTPAEQNVSFAAASGGYTTTPDWGAQLQDQIGAAALRRVEFVYTGKNGAWTQSRCRIDSVDGSNVQMQQPCWTNITSRPVFSQASGGLPNMKAGTPPTRIENAYPFLHPGQWFLDREQHVLDYVPTADQDMSRLDVEAPRLTSLVTGTGTLDNPVRDITFSGLTFADATWNDPSTNVGFADVQDNLRLTGDDPSHPQATCTFGTPPGTCPFGSLTREPGNVQWHAAHDITFSGNTLHPARRGRPGVRVRQPAQHGRGQRLHEHCRQRADTRGHDRSAPLGRERGRPRDQFLRHDRQQPDPVGRRGLPKRGCHHGVLHTAHPGGAQRHPQRAVHGHQPRCGAGTCRQRGPPGQHVERQQRQHDQPQSDPQLHAGTQ